MHLVKDFDPDYRLRLVEATTHNFMDDNPKNREHLDMDVDEIWSAVEEACELKTGTFWMLPKNRAFNSPFWGCHIPSGTPRYAPAGPWIDGDDWPSETIIPYIDESRRKYLDCTWCDSFVQTTKRTAPLTNQMDRRLLSNHAARPTKLCVFHTHHVLTGEQLTDDQVHYLDTVRERLRLPWNWEHAVAFVEARARNLPDWLAFEWARSPTTSGSWDLNMQLCSSSAWTMAESVLELTR